MRRFIAVGLGLSLITVATFAVVYFATIRTITIHDGKRTVVIHAHAGTVNQALRAAGIHVYPEDSIQPPPNTPLPAGPAPAIYITRAFVVEVIADGQTHLVRTQQIAPLTILNELKLTLGPHDGIWVDGSRLSSPEPLRTAPRQIELRRAVTVTVIAGEQQTQILTPARTVGEALWLSGRRLCLADTVTPPPDTPVTAGLTLVIEPARPITIQADGRQLQIRIRSAATVAEALALAGLPLTGKDYAIPAADQPLPADGQIRVVRLRHELVTTPSVIPFETVYQPMAEWEIDTVMQLQAGTYGVKHQLTRITYADGEEIERRVEGEVIVREPTARIMGYGTKIVVRTLETPDGIVEYWRAYTMYATSYAAKFLGRPPGSPNYGRTASGKILTKGIVAIDKRLMPFGTRMYVPGYGFAVAEDTGGGVKGRWIDLGFDDWNYESWHKTVMVYFLTPVPPPEQITWIIPATVP